MNLQFNHEHDFLKQPEGKLRIFVEVGVDGVHEEDAVDADSLNIERGRRNGGISRRSGHFFQNFQRGRVIIVVVVHHLTVFPRYGFEFWGVAIDSY